MEEIISTDVINNHTDYRGLVITDLDGTLLDSNSNIKTEDYNTLLHLEQNGFLRVIATGRNLYSLFNRIDPGFPVDYIIFSSGAGIWDQKNKRYIRMITMESDEVQKAASLFCEFSLDFAVHHPIPDNHHFSYYLQKDKNEDFIRRVQHYRDFASRWENLPSIYPRASQVLTIITGNRDNSIYYDIRMKLPGFTVIRTTSPMDHTSLWIETFPQNVSKGQASAWLASRFGVNRENTLAIGNDYNDTDLLSWAKTAYVVSNAPDELKKMFPSVVSHNECGFSAAVNKWFPAFTK
ncbi:MAG: HAD family phosphatase [Spirochaetales bacterium]|nr:HAD family phosphatase [Spirochaetales bacterium]